MPQILMHLDILDQQNRIGPDIFGFYKHEIVDLLAHDVGEFSLPLSSTSMEHVKICLKAEGNGNQTDSLPGGSSLFGDSIQDIVPDFKRQLLKSSLGQSVRALTEEVDERSGMNQHGGLVSDGLMEIGERRPGNKLMVDPVIRVRHIISFLRSRKQHVEGEAPQDKDSSVPPCKKQKTSSSNIRDLFADQNRDADNVTAKASESLKFLLESEDRLRLEETIARHSGELDAALNHMQEQLEDLLDAVVSKCRLMTRQEKQELCKLIQKLPPKNLDRVVDIIQAHHGKSLGAPSSDELSVELEEQGNVTLWRLFFYVKAVENAQLSG